jgi:phospholipid/cholesterol/gamma-HCH transport system substrate-binding protein
VTRRIAFGALAAIAVVVAVIVATGGDDSYRLRLDLANASGLKTGSPVVISGVTRGKVELHLKRDDRIEAELKIDKSVAPVGRDAKVAVTAANFLGQKRVEITRGASTANPAPSGFLVPAGNITTPTDLDQVLDVLDADTRTRATILLNELGTAVVGRRFDINQLLGEFPQGFVDATAVLRQLRSDNHSLRDLVTHADGFVREATTRRADLVRMVKVLGRTSETVSARRAELRATLARAPRTLRTLQAFLGDLESTTRPLAPAARAIADAAPALSGTLAQVEPFTAAAKPTLSQARAGAPRLTQLGDKATPVVKKALPAVTSLATLAGDLPPVAKTLDNSADNIIAILENWSRAIQFRDGLGHVFRGEAGYSTDLLTTMMDRLIRPADRKKKAKAKVKAPKVSKPDAKKTLDDVSKPVKKTLDELPKVIQDAVDGVLGTTKDALKDTLGGLAGGGAKSGGDAGRRDPANGLLDFLLKP